MITDYTDILTQEDNPLSKIKANNYYPDINTFLSDIKREIDSINRLGEHDEDKLNKLAAHARYLIAKGTPEEKRIALEQYLKLSQLFKSNNISIGKNFVRTVGAFKIGGKIRKGQKGMTAEEYRAKYSQGAPEGQFRKSMNKAEMVKNASAYDIVSMVGTGLSLIPGFGAIGGGIATISDALKGAQDGWDKEDTANLAINLGFTAASAIGLGGLKALQLGAKAVKAGKIARTASEVAENSSKVSNAVRKALTSPYLQKSVQAASTIGRGALVAVPAVSSAQGIYKSVSSAPEDMNWWDSLGRIKSSDIKSAAMATSMGSNIYRNVKYKNIIKRNTEIADSGKDIRKIKIDGKEYEISDKINVPSRLKGQFKDKTKVEKFKSELESKLVGSEEEKKKAISEIFKSEDVTKFEMPKDIKQEFIKGAEGTRKLKDISKASDVKEYEKAKKLLERRITNPGQS